MGSHDPFWAGSGVERRVGADADVVFGTLTDLSALPLWAHDVAAVSAAPVVIEPGSTWLTTRQRRGGASHVVRSTALAFDPNARRFAHHSCPLHRRRTTAYSEWRWECVDHGRGSTLVRVSWVLRPALGGPFVLLTERRDRQLDSRMLAALDRLDRLCQARSLQVTRVEATSPTARAPIPL